VTRGAAPAMAESETVIAIEEGGDRPAIVTPRLRLTFQWTGDRWSHALEWPGVVVARSVESDPRRERDEPARVISPAYQQVGFQRNGARVQALLVGQAGAHHFAAAFTVKEIGGATIVEVDVADRCRSDVSALASTYAVSLTSSDLRDADPARIVWEIAGERLTFESAEPPSLLTLAEAGRSATRVQAGATIRPETATQRWAYRWVRGSHPPIKP
jgi:hypothetical protein